MIANEENTICAVSTPAGVGGVAIIRISGKEAISISSQFFSPLNPAHVLTERKSHTLTYGVWKDGEGKIIDEVVIGLYRPPHSFTGEETIEVNCHGSLFIQQKILHSLLEGGCRMAEAGEFTQRAFLNGRIDLSQAEAVADLITATSETSHRVALTQMRGGVKKELHRLREQLLEVTSLLELELDFSEEDVQFADRKHILELSEEIERSIQRLLNSFSSGNAIKNGLAVVIVGETNVGKSTLLNRLVNEERSIVSDVHGTTRDVVVETMVLGGQLFRFIDTAGLRESNDVVEQMGMERTLQEMKKAHLLLWVVDGSLPIQGMSERFKKIKQQEKEEGIPLIVVVNKSDLMSSSQREEYSSYLQGEKHLFISAKEDKDLHLLEQTLLKESQLERIEGDEVMLTSARHYELLLHAKEGVLRVEEGLKSNLSGDLISLDLRECLHYLGEITGEISSEDVLHSIFSKFCIGK